VTDGAGARSVEFTENEFAFEFATMSPTSEPQIVVVADAAALAQSAADRLVARVKKNDRPAVCLTGGSSPLKLYHLLKEQPWRDQVPWQRVHWFMGDDRFVPQSDPLSNMGAARRAFLDSLAVPPQNIHPIPTEANDPDTAARRYEDELKRFYDADRLDPSRPLFDLVLMGLGPDGHTASLFPNSPELDEHRRWTVGVPKAGWEPFVPRVTLTFPALASTREMLFMVDSADKRQILARVLGGENLPAHRAHAQGDLVWLIIRAAAPER
jgi:6-phosphogluconolactonase